MAEQRRFKRSGTPKRMLRKFCVRCVGSSYQVNDCGGNKMLGEQGDKDNQCWFYPYRNKKGRPAIHLFRKMCLECMGGSHKLVRDCFSTKCSIHEFRFGTNPHRARSGDDNSEETDV